MKTITIANKFVSISRFFIFFVLISLPFNANAEYYLVYGPPEVPMVCDTCARPHYRHVHKVHKVKKYSCKTKKYYYRTVPRRHSHYSITVYYPVAVQPSCYTCGGCCGGYVEPSYYWVPAPYGVYYTHPNDRLVGNSYGENYYDPSLDTGTADNDIY